MNRGSLPWLLRHELRVRWRELTGETKPSTLLLAGIGILAVAHMILWGIAGSLRDVLTTPLPPAAVPLAGLAVLLVFPFGIATGVNHAVVALFDRGDLDLLVSSPLGSRIVFGSRVVAVAASVFVGLGLFMLPIGSIGLMLGIPQLLGVVPTLVALSLVCASIGMLITLLLVRWLGPRRARTVGVAALLEALQRAAEPHRAIDDAVTLGHGSPGDRQRTVCAPAGCMAPSHGDKPLCSQRTPRGVCVGEYRTVFGSMDDYEKGRVIVIDDDPKSYVFSNVFEVASMSRPYEKVAVGKNLEYVLEAIRCEGTSEWRATPHDEFALVMDGEVRVELLDLGAGLGERLLERGDVRVDVGLVVPAHDGRELHALVGHSFSSNCRPCAGRRGASGASGPPRRSTDGGQDIDQTVRMRRALLILGRWT